MDEKVKVSEHQRKKPDKSEHSRINKLSKRPGVEIVGGGGKKGVKILSSRTDQAQKEPETRIITDKKKFDQIRGKQ
jgi:hypothetical protein